MASSDANSAQMGDLDTKGAQMGELAAKGTQMGELAEKGAQTGELAMKGTHMGDPEAKGAQVGDVDLEHETTVDGDPETEKEKTTPEEQTQRQTLKFSFTGKNAAKGKSQRGGLAFQAGKGDKRKEATEKRDYVVAIDGMGIVSTMETKVSAGPAVIPLQENSWKLHGGKKARCSGNQLVAVLDDVVLDADLENDRFEDEVSPEGQPGGNVHYGLEIRGGEARGSGSDAQSVLVCNAAYDQELERQRMREDFDNLPDTDNTETYESMPIELFGEALLRGMGWEKGKSIGQRGDGVVVDPMEYIPRPGRLGLGAVPGAPTGKEANDEKQKAGDRKAPRGPRGADTGLPVGPDGRVEHMRNLEEKGEERIRPGGVAVGKTMEIVAGRHHGLHAVVLTVDLQPRGSRRSDRATVRLEESNEVITVRLKELAELEGSNHRRKVRDAEVSREEEEEVRREDKKVDDTRGSGPGEDRVRSKDHVVKDERRGQERGSGQPDHEKRAQNGGSPPSQRKDGRGLLHREDAGKVKDHHGDSMIMTRGNPARRSGVRNEDAGESGEKGKAKRHQHSEVVEHGQRPPKTSWLMGGIKVRIINKRLADGRVYLKKATVADVIGFSGANKGHMLCDILLDETGKLLRGVDESSLETALPKRGGRVLIVSGSSRGQSGKLIDKDQDRGRATVQLHDDLTHVSVRLDDVAEFVGHVDEDEF